MGICSSGSLLQNLRDGVRVEEVGIGFSGGSSAPARGDRPSPVPDPPHLRKSPYTIHLMGTESKQRFTRLLLLYLAIEYVALFLASYAMAYGAISGGWTAFWALPLLFLASPVSILAILLAVRCRRGKTANRYLCLLVILFSVVFVVPYASIPVARFLSISLEGMAGKHRELQIESGARGFAKRMERSREREKERRYGEVVELFSQPVAMVEARHSYILFDNGLVGKLVGSGWHPDVRPDWLHKYLLGKELRVEVVERERFVWRYGRGNQMFVFGAKRSKGYGDVPVYLYADGESVDDVIRERHREYAKRRESFESEYGHRIESFMRREMYAEAETEILSGLKGLEAGSIDSAIPMIALLKNLVDVYVFMDTDDPLALEKTMARRERLAADVYGAESDELLAIHAEHWSTYEKISRRRRGGSPHSGTTSCALRSARGPRGRALSAQPSVADLERRRRPRPRRRPLPPSASRTGLGPSEPLPRASPEETSSASCPSGLPRPPAFVGRQALSLKSIRRDHEDAGRFRVRHVDDSQLTPCRRLPQGDSCALLAQPVLTWARQDLFDLGFSDPMTVDVGVSRGLIQVETELHVA